MDSHIPAHGDGHHAPARKRFLAFTLVIALVVGSAIVYWWHSANGISARGEAEQASSAATNPEHASTDIQRSKAPESDASASAKNEEQRKLDTLRTQLEQQIQGYQGNWQVYVADMATGAAISMNNHQQPSASLIKLYIMLAVFQQINDGQLSDDTQIDGLLTQMITVSSNQAANSLVSTLGNGDVTQGFKVVNATATRYGFTQSSQTDLLYDSGTHDSSKKVTSAQDCGKFMTAIYNNGLVSHDASQRMLTLLLAQTRRSKIPAGLPDGTHVANKTGEIPGTENDAALVYTTSGAYVITVLTQNIDNSSTAQANIRQISKTTWEQMIA
jgi:beta-lactamase class A